MDMIFRNFWENAEIAVKRCVDHFLSKPFRPGLKVSCFLGSDLYLGQNLVQSWLTIEASKSSAHTG